MRDEFIQELSEDLIKLYNAVETDLLVNIVDKLNRGWVMFPEVPEGEIRHWQLQRLYELDGLNKENAEIIARATGKSVKEIEDIFDRALGEAINISEHTLKMAVEAGILSEAIEVKDSQVIKNIIAFAKNQTKTTFNKMNKTIVSKAGQVYTDIINEVSTKVISGITTPQVALGQAIKEWNSKGIPAFVAQNGAEWTPEAYGSMVIRSNVKNTVTEIQTQRSKEYGNDYIQITAYSGARPKCFQDQGKIYSLSGNTTPIRDINGKLITVYDWNSTSYGEPDGILGINCGHERFIFVPSFSEFNKETIPKKENDEEYKNTQQLRYLEREIRKAKREKLLFERSGLSTEDAKMRVSDLQRQTREFVKEKGLPRRPDREKIF